MSAAASWLAARAQATPEAEALVGEGRALSWAALAARVAGATDALADAGVGAGERVALRLPAGADAFVALLATWERGACAVPLHLRLPPAAQEGQIARVGATLVVDAPLEAKAATRVPGAVPSPVPYDAEAPAVVLFTSGTSGTPKPAVLRYRNLAASARASRAHLGTGVGDRWLACLPFFHVGGLSILARALCDGAGVLIQPRFDVEAVSEAIDERAITRVSLVPTTLKRLLDAREDRPPPPTLRTVLVGGAAAPPALLARARAAGFPVLASYGLTETASQVATAAPEDPPDGRVGRALPGSEFRICDPDGRVLAVGEEGEIQVRGPTVFAGVLGDAAASRAALGADGWLRTGDVGRLDAEARLQVLDRRSDRIISGGENVHPAAVEAALLEHPAVDEVAVWRLPDADLGHRVVAWVVPRAGAALSAESLDAHARARLAGHERPREVRFLAELPRNAMGKVVRRELG